MISDHFHPWTDRQGKSIHHVGPDQRGVLAFYTDAVLPRLGDLGWVPAAAV